VRVINVVLMQVILGLLTLSRQVERGGHEDQ
jgi:hypothetical protein